MARLLELVREDGALPSYLSGQLFFFAGPTPAHPGNPGHPFGSIGPTTASRMDAAQIELMPAGVLLTLGKGDRSAAYHLAASQHGALYFVTTGGAAAVLAHHVVSAETVAWPELGTEALMKLELDRFPAVVAIDSSGDSLYEVPCATFCSDTQDPRLTPALATREFDSGSFGTSAQDDKGKGTFVTFEGGEGAGKTTQIELLAAALRETGAQVLTLREPGSSPISEAIRAILLDPANTKLSPSAELFLYEAARAQLVIEVIRPALEAGTVVICDRFFDSTTAYQGYARGLDIDETQALNLLATDGLVPDRSIVLDLAPAEGLPRATKDTADRLERESLDFHERVRAGFLAIAAEEPHRVRVVDATGTPEQVAAAVRTQLSDLFPQLAGLEQ